MDVLRLLITTAGELYASGRSGTWLNLEKREAGLGREFKKIGRRVQAAVVQFPMRVCFALACACTHSQETEDTKMKHDLPWTAQGTSIPRARTRTAPSSGT